MTPPNKRGVTYVDWAISFGLFVITVILLLILLRPRIAATYDKEDLVNIVYDNFIAYSSWNVQLVPIFVEKFQPFSGPTATPTLLKITYNPAADVDYESSQYEKQAPPLTLRCTGSTTTACSPATILLYISPQTGPDVTPELQLECDPDNPAICEALLGATENFYGLKQSAIDAFKVLPYEDQKVVLGIPPTADAAIFVDNVQITNNDKPPLQTNVYTREFNTWVLGGRTQTTPTLIRLQAWR